MARAFQCDVCGKLYSWVDLKNIDPFSDREASATPVALKWFGGHGESPYSAVELCPDCMDAVRLALNERRPNAEPREDDNNG